MSSALRDVDGVESVLVNFSAKTATVIGNNKLAPQNLVEALKKTGSYRGTLFAPTKTYQINVTNMSTVGDVNRIKAALKAVKGVQSVTINLGKGIATIVGDKKQMKGPKVLKAVNDLDGYSATAINPYWVKRYKVEGMTNPGDVSKVKKIAQAIKGVKSIKVHFKYGTAKVIAVKKTFEEPVFMAAFKNSAYKLQAINKQSSGRVVWMRVSGMT